MDTNRRLIPIEGVVVKWLDSRHILVRLKNGKLVSVYVSPIYAAAIVIGGTVILNLQGDEYMIVDVVASPAALVNTADWINAGTRLTALEASGGGGSGVNLIQNPWGAPYGSYWSLDPIQTAIGWSLQVPGAPEWIPDTNDEEAGYPYWAFSPLAYWPDCPAPLNVQPDNPPQTTVLVRATIDPFDIIVYPTLAGTSAPVVTPGDYALSCVGMIRFGDPQGFQLGVQWMDSSGVAISEDYGTATSTADQGRDWYYRFTSAHDPPYDLTSFATALPADTFTAPTGAAFGRPFVKITAAASVDTYVTGWDFHRAS